MYSVSKQVKRLFIVALQFNRYATLLRLSDVNQYSSSSLRIYYVFFGYAHYRNAEV